MCGIVGYVGETGHRDLMAVLVAGLERLSYRGYDSSGVAVIDNGELSVWKSAGKVHRLVDRFLKPIKLAKGSAGIAHTRWATHGAPTDRNAHPHISSPISALTNSPTIAYHGDKKTALVHNGIIENFSALKTSLAKDVVFQSETDTEVIVHLIEHKRQQTKTFLEALHAARTELAGTYSLAIVSEEHPETLFATRFNAPLIIGVGEGENFLASDLVALIPHTRRFIHLEDHETAVITGASIEIFGEDGTRIEKETVTLPAETLSLSTASKGDYPHYMLKEIFEQPAVLKRIHESYVKDNKTIVFNTLPPTFTGSLKSCRRFHIQACGTSWHAGLIAKYWIESLAHIPAEVDVSSEFRYRRILTGESDMILALSQSGETADTLAGIREVRKTANLPVISFVNRRETTMERESDAIIPSLAGLEIGVASTKNFIAQLGTLYLFALHLAQLHGRLDEKAIYEKLTAFAQLSEHVEHILTQSDDLQATANMLSTYKGFFFIGRGVNFPIALEGALKLKEVSYLYAAGHAAGELKHGPIALIDEDLPVFVIIPQGSHYTKMMSNLEEVRSRKGKIIALASEGDIRVPPLVEKSIALPVIPEELSPLLSVIPLQLLAYHMAVSLKRDVDQPKNLAKSVTVE